MAKSLRVLTKALIPFTILAADGRGQQLLEVDGIELRGDAAVVMSGGGTCNVLESDTRYEAKKENRGAPMDIWRLDFTVRNGSGRWLDHLIARYQIESEWPECTNWDGPEAGAFAQNIEWADSAGHIQESGRNVVGPGRTLTETKFFIVLRGDPEPQFANWSLDFDFAVAPPTAESATGAAEPPSAPQVPAATAEQETVFWQSIADSTNPAEFEAYLSQFPNGVFRALAEARLAALRERPDGTPPMGRPNSASTTIGQPEPLCGGRPEGAQCWIELANQPGCYLWDEYYDPGGGAPRWNGGCSDGLANGTGTVAWQFNGRSVRVRGSVRNGKHHGCTVVSPSDDWDEKGRYVDGQRQGRWDWYDETGRHTGSVVFKDGELVAPYPDPEPPSPC